jgi:prepilin-type N-terminal cleavage/methylation domain-containing protein
MGVKRQNAFTLIEVLIVVVIMAVLAATIIPQFSSSTQDAKDNQRDFNIHTLQSQIQLYKVQHGGTFPAITSNALPQLTSKTDDAGTIDTSGEFGPYILEMPTNPYTNSTTVTASTDGSEATGGGWLYDAATGRIWADSAAPVTP